MSIARFVASVLLGLLVSAALSYALSPFRMTPPDAPWTFWYMGINRLGDALLAVAPGFVAGWCAKRRGLVVGAVVGVLATTGSLVFAYFRWGPFTPAMEVMAFAFGVAAGVITQSIAGVAGAFLRSRVHP